jgi:hypothetical protein
MAPYMVAVRYDFDLGASQCAASAATPTGTVTASNPVTVCCE